MPKKLDQASLEEALAPLAGWTRHPERAAIVKLFQFKDFAAAFAWMTQMALVAEKMDHHPEWENIYRQVRVVLTTHSAEGITPLDIKLANEMNRCAKLYEK